VFVTFEGLDGSGKSTQAELLAGELRDRGREVVLTREPGGTELGERVREMLLTGGDVSPWAEAALFAAARAELVERVIRPALGRGADVVCDRYVDSSLAYQGIARGLGVERVLELNRPAIGDLLPDRTFLLLVDAELAGARSGDEPDRIEREGADFRERVEAAYEQLAGTFADRIVTVDGSLPPEEIAAHVVEQVRQLS
jgi:dTMP kinase